MMTRMLGEARATGRYEPGSAREQASCISSGTFASLLREQGVEPRDLEGGYSYEETEAVERLFSGWLAEPEHNLRGSAAWQRAWAAFCTARSLRERWATLEPELAEAVVTLACWYGPVPTGRPA